MLNSSSAGEDIYALDNFKKYLDSHVWCDLEAPASFEIKELAGESFSDWDNVTTNHAEGLNNPLKLLCCRNELLPDAFAFDARTSLLCFA